MNPGWRPNGVTEISRSETGLCAKARAWRRTHNTHIIRGNGIDVLYVYKHNIEILSYTHHYDKHITNNWFCQPFFPSQSSLFFYYIIKILDIIRQGVLLKAFGKKRRAEIYLQLYKCKSFIVHEHIDKKKPHKKYTMFQIRRAAVPLLTA